MQTLTRPITSTEFRAMDFEEYKTKEFIFELINGEIVARNFPTFDHQRALKRLAFLFEAFVVKNNLGEVIFTPFGVVLDDFDDVQPDIMFVCEANRQIITREGIYGAPDLVVEVISPSSIKTDRTTKFKLYERMQVPEYWIVDVKNQSIEVYQRQETGYELVSFGVEKGDVTSTVLAGLRVDVAALFA
jgi:Uma2 family endonuclease